MSLCAKCSIHACSMGDKNNRPKFCPMEEFPEIYDEASKFYQDSLTRVIACSSARTEAAGYGIWPRLIEVMEFARRAGFSRLGLAFCVGLSKEARAVNDIFENNGFTVYSVACKNGSRPKEELGLKDDEKVRPGQFEAMCNPVAQALLLDKQGSELNVLLGLCVGHDTLFSKYSRAPVTVLAVKDRVLAHNPLGAIYAAHYYRKRFKF